MHQIQPKYRDEQAEAGRDRRIRLARPNSQARTWTGTEKNHFPCLAHHEQDWQPYPVDPYLCFMCNHTYTSFTYLQLLYLMLSGTHLNILSIPQSGGKNAKRFIRGDHLGCKEKSAPMVVALGQHNHVGDVFCGPVHYLTTITELRSDAYGPGCHQLAILTAIYASLRRYLFVGSSCCGSGWFDC